MKLNVGDINNMPEDYNIQMEEFKEKGFLTEEHPLMKSRLNELVRKSQIILLTDFVKWLESNGLIDEDAEPNIEAFLNERHK